MTKRESAYTLSNPSATFLHNLIGGVKMQDSSLPYLFFANDNRSKTLDLTGLTFGSLLVLRYHGKVGVEHAWDCQCLCGQQRIVTGHALKGGTTRSCGCLQRQTILERNTRHGLAKRGEQTTEYRTWKALKNRCYNKNSKAYKNYGGRGITVCDKWIDNYPAFILDMGLKPKGYTIERKDNDLGYNPENCIWTTRLIQANNKRNNKLITYDNQTKTITQWAEFLGVHRQLLRSRFDKGWLPEIALTTPRRCNQYG